MQNQKNFKNPEVTLSSENNLDYTMTALNEVEIAKNKIDWHPHNKSSWTIIFHVQEFILDNN